MSVEREMTLTEYVGRLPEIHAARKELATLQAKVTELGKVCEAGESISAHKETATSSEWESFDEALRAAGYEVGV